MSRKFIYCFLIVILFADLTYSFLQHYSMPLDGDIAGGIVPAEDVKPVLKDPFGISVITINAVYPNPNRYFAHWTFFTYFNTVPLWLQSIAKPIDSIYLSCAIAKISIQILIMTLLAFYITGRIKICDPDFLIASILIVPLFQTNGYSIYMGVIDPSITYTFFYALPTAIMLLFYMPFFIDSIYKTTLLKKWSVKIFVFVLALYISFDGALNPGIILITTLLYGLNCFLISDKNMSFIQRIIHAYRVVPKTYLFFFSLVSLLSLYALYIGTNNSIFIGETVSIMERYSRIPTGVINILTKKLGFAFLLFMIGINIVLMRRNLHSTFNKKLLRLFSWIGLFSLFYILLLPLGGFKIYRPNILRYDTIMPITIGLIFIYAISSFQLIKHFKSNSKIIYLSVIVVFTIVFSNADKPEFDKNDCERLALEKLSKSKNKVVFVENDCTILSWHKITDPTKSALNGQLLKKWKITSDDKFYYQNE